MSCVALAYLFLSLDQPEIGPPPTPAGALNGLKRDYDAFYKKWSDDYQAAKEADRPKLLEAWGKETDAAAQRALKLAQENPDNAAAFDALDWVITGLASSEITPQALDLVAKCYVAHPKVGGICQIAPYRDYRGTEDLLRAVLEKNPERQVRGVACFTLAGVLHYQQFASIGKKSRELTLDQLRREGEALYRRTIEEYGDVRPEGSTRTLRERVEATLFAAKNLKVGKVAPEIAGEDVDGKRFTLSDYRGKVVVLVFWGHW